MPKKSQNQGTTEEKNPLLDQLQYYKLDDVCRCERCPCCGGRIERLTYPVYPQPYPYAPMWVSSRLDPNTVKITQTTGAFNPDQV